MKSIVESSNSNGYDSEPDLFTFNCNGLSGSFVFDASMNVVQIPYGNYKMDYNFASTDWTLKITDGSGISYYFGGTTAIEKTKRTTTCSKFSDLPLITSLSTKKIEHPSGETINFVYSPFSYSYDVGLSETMTLAASWWAIWELWRWLLCSMRRLG